MLPEHGPEAAELTRQQREMLEAFTVTLADDDELTCVLFALEEEKYKPAEIAAATDLPADRVSELKRKLSDRANKFLKTHPQYADLKPMGAVK